MPTYIFGEGPTATVSGTHKDTYLISVAAGASGATEVDLFTLLNGRFPLLRFDISSIGAGETIDSATLRLYIATTALTGDANISAHALNIAWGVTDTAEGASANPATDGQATFQRSKDFNGGGGDVTWGAGNYSAADYGAAVDPQTVGVAANVGDPVDWTLTAMINSWHTGATTNNGIALISDRNEALNFDSQESVTAAERPLLTVVTTVGGGTGSSVARQKSSTSVGIGIGV